MFHKIVKLKTLPDYMLYAEFDDGVIKTYNIGSLFDKFPVFQALQNKSLFSLAKIDIGGYGVVWNDEIDIDAQEIYVNGK